MCAGKGKHNQFTRRLSWASKSHHQSKPQSLSHLNPIVPESQGIWERYVRPWETQLLAPPPQRTASSLEPGSREGAPRVLLGTRRKQWQRATAEGGGLLGCVGGCFTAAFPKHTLSLYGARKVRRACVSEENENVKGETGDSSYTPKFGESSLKLVHDLANR